MGLANMTVAFASQEAVNVDFHPYLVAFQIGLFVVLMLVLKPILFDPMMKLFEEREKRIDGAKAAARSAPDTHGPAKRGAGAPGHGPDRHAPAHGADPSGDHAEGHGHWPPPGINWRDQNDKPRPPFIAMLVNFAILAGGFYVLGKKPVAAALKERRASVAKEIEEAQRMKREAEKRAEQYQAKLGRLEEELATAKAALVEAGKGEKERIVREAEEKAARMQKDAEFLIEQEV